MRKWLVIWLRVQLGLLAVAGAWYVTSLPGIGPYLAAFGAFSLMATVALMRLK